MGDPLDNEENGDMEMEWQAAEAEQDDDEGEGVEEQPDVVGKSHMLYCWLVIDRNLQNPTMMVQPVTTARPNTN